MNISFVWAGKDDFSVSSISSDPPGSLTEKSLFLGDYGTTLLWSDLTFWIKWLQQCLCQEANWLLMVTEVCKPLGYAPSLRHKVYSTGLP